jgi:hypothetical protein
MTTRSLTEKGRWNMATAVRTRKIVSREAANGELDVLGLRCGGFAASVVKPVGAEKELHVSAYYGAFNVLSLFEEVCYCEGFLPLSRVKTLVEQLSFELGQAEQHGYWDDHCEWLDCLHEALAQACAWCAGDACIVIGTTA